MTDTPTPAPPPMPGPRLVELDVGGDPDAWRAAGFDVVDDRIVVGPLTLVVGDVTSTFGFDRPLGAKTLLGVPCRVVADPEPALSPAAGAHPNGTDGFDHVVVMAPDLDGVRAELAAAGMEIRRERPTTIAGSEVVQVFAWAGDVLLEIVAPAAGPDAETVAPPSDPGGGVWGVALTAADLDATAAALGAAASAPRAAVQPGRRILSLRRRDLGLPLEVAIMSGREST